MPEPYRRTPTRAYALILLVFLIGAGILPAACGQAEPPSSQQPATPEEPPSSPVAVVDTVEPAGSPETSEPATLNEEQRDAAMAVIREKFTGDLDGMIERRVIRVATTYNRTHYFIDKGVQRGVAYEAFKLFEDELNAKLKTKNLRVNVVFIPMSREQLLQSVVDGRADIAAAGLTVTSARQKLVDFSQPTRSGIDEIVVTGPGAPALKSLDDLAGRDVFVRASSSYHEHLVALNARLRKQGLKEIVLKPAPETLEDDDVLEMVNAGLVKIAVVDNYIAEFWKPLLPQVQLHPALAVATGGVFGVAVRKNSPQLMAEANAWVARHGPRTMFGNLITQRYLKDTKFARNATSSQEIKRFQDTVALFRKYGDQYSVDYLLVAAQGFQESGLDHTVRSPVGAIGVMQVMPATGKDLKVGDITQLDPNIHAGVKYVRFMIDNYFENERIDRLNKGLFAFASYNAGPNRIRQLRQEAAKRGLDPNVWFNNVEQIASERIGRETVTYVSNIYKYYIAYRLALDELEQRRQIKPAS
jgi:membrane-bound lytic murein transglycosylase MltF